jgi:hypothetical protein
MLLPGVSLVALSVLLWSQNRRSSVQHGRSQEGILGYLDAGTGAFRPVPQHSVDADSVVPESTVIYTGKFVYSFTITLSSTIPKGDVIQCLANMNDHQKKIASPNTIRALRLRTRGIVTLE